MRPWLTIDSTGPSSDEVLSNHNSADPRKTRKSILVTLVLKFITHHHHIEAQGESTTHLGFLLVGETDAGKSLVLEHIATVFAGNNMDHYNFDILDHTNEPGRANHQSQTN